MSDESANDYDSLEPILQFPNTSSRRIVALSGRTRPSQPGGIDLRIRLASDGVVDYEVAGETEKDVLHNARILEDLLSGIRQWYTPLTSPYLFSALVGFAVGLATPPMISLTVDMAIKRARKEPVEPVVVPRWTWVAMFVALGFLAFILLRPWLFPAGEFAIGQGEDRHARLVFWRRTVLGVGVLVPVAVGLLWKLVVR